MRIGTRIETGNLRARLWLAAGLVLAASFLAEISAVPAAASDTETDTVRIIYGVGIGRTGSYQFSKPEQRSIALLQEADIAVQLDYIPFPRIQALYRGTPGACINFTRGPIADGELESAVFITHKYWIYTTANSVHQSIKSLRRVAILAGGQRYFDASAYPQIEWVKGVNWKAVVDQLFQNRVEAAVLGAKALEFFPGETTGLKRLHQEPFVVLPMSIHCKNTPKNASFIDALNARLATSP